MSKRAISVTLQEENLVWLRGQSRAARHRSVSETLDRLITEARSRGGEGAALVRSVRDTIRISDGDPQLLQADAAIRALFHASTGTRGGVRRRAARRRG
jgi:hypothetical protein